MSLPTLMEISYDRIFTGTPSTTQLLNPTRYEYLKIKFEYSINPFDRAFALLGTRHHRRLEIIAKTIEGLLAEKKLSGECSGVVDLVEPNPVPNTYRLTDYKSWGSYQVAKILNGSEYELLKVELQLGNYRLMVIDELGLNITELFVQATIRDGGTWMAKKNGITDKMLLIPIKILEDTFIREYFLTKSFALKSALDNNVIPALCDFQERWSGRRCHPEYCEVVSRCPEGAKINKVEYKPNDN